MHKFAFFATATANGLEATRIGVCATLALFAAFCLPSLGRVDTSAWSSRVGTIGLDDKTTWCTPEVLTDANGLSYARSRFRLIAPDGTVTDPVTNPLAAQQVKLQCFQNSNLTGTTSTVTSALSTDGAGDVVTTPKCPAAQKYGGYARCQISTGLLPPYVYAGTSCGAGITGVTGPATMRGQMTGDHYELYPPQPPWPAPQYPQFNNTSTNGGVNGTDLGYHFHAQGSLYFGFGDSWQFEGTVAGALDPRGSVLFRTNDFNPADSNGIAFSGWESVPGNPSGAREVIPSPHDFSGNSEWTAIASAGLGITEGGVAYRFLWFCPIKQWSPFTYNNSTLAWSVGSGAFVRGDQQPPGPPVWLPDTYFGVGAIWPDRETGYAYFFGLKTYSTTTPIRVARVKMTAAALRDRTQYQYWNGSSWVQDVNGDYQEAKWASQTPGTPGPDLISPGRAPRPEFSVAYNAYVGRFFMMFVNANTTNIELWQAAAVTGPWSLVAAYPPATSGQYGPYASDHLIGNGGQDFYFLLSEWNGLPAPFGQPYNVGLWKATFTRATIPGCIP